jgi:uncharacterized protein
VFAGVDAILHAGDIGKPEVLDQLAEIAPVTAVRGNNDAKPRLQELPERRDFLLNGVWVHLVHRPQDALPRPNTRIVVFGHTHRPLSESRGNILFLNPGAAGRQGFQRERTAAILEIDQELSARSILLGPRSERLLAPKRSLS